MWQKYIRNKSQNLVITLVAKVRIVLSFYIIKFRC